MRYKVVLASLMTLCSSVQGQSAPQIGRQFDLLCQPYVTGSAKAAQLASRARLFGYNNRREDVSSNAGGENTILHNADDSASVSFGAVGGRPICRILLTASANALHADVKAWAQAHQLKLKEGGAGEEETVYASGALKVYVMEMAPEQFVVEMSLPRTP
ncbi:hypothetical protein [Thermomonas sp.]|uniref:hypothetical protein n=1 Tax=Thermomonas sp. TaxID=1971895 RepID=UPI00262645E2|nr:hypothetical protein [Thermomonas sp.]